MKHANLTREINILLSYTYARILCFHHQLWWLRAAIYLQSVTEGEDPGIPNP